MTPSLLRLAASRIRSAPRRARWRAIEALRPRRLVQARGLELTLQSDNWITQFRAETIETKEPETLDWIDQHVRERDLLFDIGANIGVIALYAALRHPASRIIAFEPEYANLHLLRDNIIANGVGNRIQVYPIALGERSGPSMLYVQDLTPGAALHSESATRLDRTDSGERVIFSEGTWVMKLDEFCEQSGCWPDVMKIDVDGAEPRVLAGARAALARPTFRSLIIEAGRHSADAAALLAAAGLRRMEMAPGADNEVWMR